MKVKSGTVPIKTSAIKTLLLFLVTFGSVPTMAQVGINNANPERSAILDLTDNKRGLLIPRMTSQQRMDILTEVGQPAEGLLVYDTDDELFYYYNPGNNDGDNGAGDQNWQALSPLLFKDARDHTIENGSGQTVFLRTIESHESVKDVILFESTPGSYDEDTAPRLLVEGQLSVGSGVRAPSAAGLYVHGESKFDGDLRIAGKLGQYTEYGTTNLVYETTFVGYGTAPIGSIIMWTGDPSVLPPSWKLCDGNGTFVNEMGQTMNVPDLRNRFILGAGDAYEVGETGGEEEVALTVAQMPSHSHGLTDDGHSHGYKKKWHGSTKSDNDDGRSVAAHNRFSNPGKTTSSSGTGITLKREGEGEPHNNMPPYYALAYIIRVN